MHAHIKTKLTDREYHVRWKHPEIMMEEEGTTKWLCVKGWETHETNYQALEDEENGTTWLVERHVPKSLIRKYWKERGIKKQVINSDVNYRCPRCGAMTMSTNGT